MKNCQTTPNKIVKRPNKISYGQSLVHKFFIYEQVEKKKTELMTLLIYEAIV